MKKMHVLTVWLPVDNTRIDNQTPDLICVSSKHQKMFENSIFWKHVKNLATNWGILFNMIYYTIEENYMFYTMHNRLKNGVV